MSESANGVTYKYYLSTFYRNEFRNRPIRVSFDARGEAIAVERIHPVTGELEVMEGYFERWGKRRKLDNDPYKQEIDAARFAALRQRMLAPPQDTQTYEYFLYASTLVRIKIDSHGDRYGAEYVDRRTGKFVSDATYISKITFDWNDEAEEIDQDDFQRLHQQILSRVC